MGLDATNSVFGVSDKVRLKPVSSATKINYKNEASLVASLYMILFKRRIKKGAYQPVHPRKLIGIVLVHTPEKQFFLASRPMSKQMYTKG